MLRTASSLPLTGPLTLGFAPTRFQTKPPACYRATWQLPGPDSHRQATTSLRTATTYIRQPPVLLDARKREASVHAVDNKASLREEGLKRPARTRKKRRLGEGRNQRLRAPPPDHMWALDFQTDLTVDGRQVRFLNIIGEYTREALATRPFRSCTADQLCTVLDDIIASTGRSPAHTRTDNGTEMTAHAMTDWCRFTGVDPSFNGRYRDEFLISEQFDSMPEVQVLA